MNRFLTWYGRQRTVLLTLSVLLAASSALLPRWLLLPAAIVAGAGMWNAIYFASMHSRFDRDLNHLRDEVMKKVEEMGGLAPNPALHLHINAIAEDHLKVTWTLRDDLTPFEIRRLAVVLADSARDLDHLADEEAGTRTSEYPGGQNPSLN